jgi:hypothetical protein
MKERWQKLFMYVMAMRKHSGSKRYGFLIRKTVLKQLKK